MEIRMRDTGEVMTAETFRSTICSLPPTTDVLAQFNADIVFEGPQARFTPPYEFSYRDGVVQVEDGRWFTKYSIGPVFKDTETQTAAEQMDEYKARMDAEQATRVRTSRNEALKGCDWTQVADSTANRQAWADFRQALRDIPDQSGFPWTVTWPDAPV